jgi:hypothetical protein
MSDDTANDLIERLPAISLQLTRIVLIIQIVLGTFGNIINILIFTRRSLRTNPCSIYFLASSINNIFAIYVVTLTRLLSSGWNIDPSNTNPILCKLRIFFVYISLTLIQWYVVLASIDRYLSSCQSAHRRQMSSVSTARKAIALITLVIVLAHFHTLVWWTADYIGSETYCNIFTLAYEIAFQVFFLVITCIVPPMIMAVFGALTVFNVKKLGRQVAPQNNDARNDRLRSKDRQLIVMLIIQVFVTIFCTLPFSVANIVSVVTEYAVPLSDYDSAIFTFFVAIARILLYFNPVAGFYIYTLAGRTFRNEMKAMFIEAMKFVLPKLGLEKYIPTGRQDHDRSMTQEQTATTTGAKKQGQNIMHRGKVADIGDT